MKIFCDYIYVNFKYVTNIKHYNKKFETDKTSCFKWLFLTHESLVDLSTLT